MAGGVFQSQNKIRPGAYIKFQGVPAQDNIVGSRGIMTMAAPIGWGPEDELITITVNDLYNSICCLLAYEDKENLNNCIDKLKAEIEKLKI